MNMSDKKQHDETGNPETSSHKVPIQADPELIGLFTKIQRRLYLFILQATGNPDQAEEVLQETNVVILTKLDQFQKGTNFHAWACQIAHFEILKFRQKKHRSKLIFSDDFVQHVVSSALQQDDSLNELKQKALRKCLTKLRPQDREIIEQRYNPDVTTEQLAELLHRPANSIYQSIGRIRRTLLDCVKRELSLEKVHPIPGQ